MPTLEAELEGACKLLESGGLDAMDASAAALEWVARVLTLRGDCLTQAEVARLRRSLQRARLLLDGAARFHTRWHNILAGMSGGYTAEGRPGGAFRPRARRGIGVSHV